MTMRAADHDGTAPDPSPGLSYATSRALLDAITARTRTAGTWHPTDQTWSDHRP